MEHLNHALFLLINAPVTPSPGMRALAIFLAEYLIWIIPAGLMLGWFLGDERMRKRVLSAAMAGCLGLVISQLIGLIWPHPRPFMIGLGHNLVAHAPDASMPSDHLTLFWSVALSLCARRWTRTVGVTLTLLGLPMAWARIYVGVHFPLDILGALMVAGTSAWVMSQAIPARCLNALYPIAMIVHDRLKLPARHAS